MEDLPVKIGVFDSGVGGKSVANAIQNAIPHLDILVVEDSKNLPYGTKSPEQLIELVVPLLEDMVSRGCVVIVIACNTVTTTIIEQLRAIISVPLVGMEPMVKPAAELTKSKIITVCATPATLGSGRYSWLKDTYAQGLTVLEPDCSEWAAMIESDQLDRQVIHAQMDESRKKGADVIVLGCTHYHWIEDIVRQESAGWATVLQPERPVIKQLRAVLARLT